MLALKAIITDCPISQAELARDVGVSPATIAELINHEKWPKSILADDLKGRITAALAKHGTAVDAAAFLPVADVDASAAKPEEELTMLMRKQKLSPATLRHFNLFRDPFDNDINDADDVYSSPDIRFVREYMHSTALHGGFLGIFGESGAGKSTLRKDLEDRLLRDGANVVLIQPYVLGMEDNDKKGKTMKAGGIIDAIINTVAPNETPKSSMEAKSRQLHRILKDSYTSGAKHCLVIEEAHSLNTQTLKHLKRFLELEIGFKKLLSIILIGQTELKTKLSERSPEVREVVQRCELVELTPLDAHLESYLRFKFERVGKVMDETLDKSALEAIRERLIFKKGSRQSVDTISLMYPLMINNLVAKAMNDTAGLGFPKVTAEQIREA